MTASRRVLPLVLLALWVAMLGGVAPARAQPSPAAERAEIARFLRTHDVYVTPREVGEVAPTLAARLQSRVDALRGKGFDVKLVVAARLGGSGPFSYAQQLRREMRFAGTVVVTTLYGPVGAAGPRPTADIRARFTAARVNATGSASQRLERAADLAVPAPPTPPKAWRGLVAFITLAILGAAAAIGWGLRREQRVARRLADQERAALVAGLDALASHITVIEASPQRDDEPVAEALAAARQHHSAGRAAAQLAGPAFDSDGGFRALHAGLREAAVAAERAGQPFPAEQPYEGLCSADPAHGEATEVATLADRDGRVPVCRRCSDAASEGTPARRRLLPTPTGPVPYDEVPLHLAESAGDSEPREDAPPRSA